MASNKLKDFFSILDLSNSLFGLPFAYLGGILAAGGWPTLYQMFWITVAMVSARTAAMCLNRLIDRHIDRANPRTSHWALAEGRLSVNLVWLLVPILFIILFYAASRLNPLCLKLAPLAVAVLWLYSYTKRFTWLCHLFLGMAIGIGPVGAWIAVTGTFDWQPFLLGAAVAFWIAGFDTIYACPDEGFDRSSGLYSAPVRFGTAGALLFAKLLHVLVVLFFVINGLVFALGKYYYIGVFLAAMLLLYEHMIVQPDNLSKVTLIFSKINHWVGLIIFVFTLIDIFGI